MSSARMPSSRTRESRKTTRAERPKVKPRPPTSLQTVRSMPLDSRVAGGSPSADGGRKVESGAKLASLKEKDTKEKGQRDAKRKENLSYSSKRDERPSADAKDVGDAKGNEESPCRLETTSGVERSPEEAKDMGDANWNKDLSYILKSTNGEDRSLGEAKDVGDAEGYEDSPYSLNTTFYKNRPLEEEEGEVRLSNPATAKMLPISPSRTESNWGDTSSFVMKKKLQAWCQLSNGDWALGTILSSSGTESVISLSEGGVLKVNTESLLASNPEILDGVDDLMQLSYLNEPSVLYNLQLRYSRDSIYTKAGPVLVAINPFKEVHLYGNEYIEAYKRKSINSPHVYAIADTAIREMIRDDINQSIVISGESGAGKTETAKIAMQYLAALGGGSGIEYEILQTNPILEAFGNARTLRNDNSSRFGKLTEIHFSVTGKISGASIQTFLLEKSRVVQCAVGERSYHIFYQLCAGAPRSLRAKLNLRKVDEYKYLKQSNCYTIAGVDDAKRFHLVMKAMDVVHISKVDQESVFAMLAAVLWLGNISFMVIDNENHVEVVPDEGAQTVSKLIGCTVSELNLALSTRKMKVGNDNIVQKLTLAQAIDTRDALAKSLYASLFEWLVGQINKSLGIGKRHTGRSISILDIYGFESFDKNSFEQFCINYANERLQQHFNRHLFKLEQEEYVQDGIDWAKVDFDDNQDCLNLFEKRPLGLLSLLDEESTFPNGTDLTFVNKLKQHLHSSPCFRGERDKAFTIHHYAGEVVYDTTGFLEKNRDLLHMDIIQLLANCKCHLPQIFASKMLSQSENSAASPYRSNVADSQKLSVASKFKGQLFQLMQRLGNTTPHFIRCIKPNNSQLPETYEQGLILQQLRCCGVLEVVRISRSVIRSEKTRRVSSGLLRRHRAAIALQRNIKCRAARRNFVDVRNASIAIQSVIRGWLVRRCSRDVALLNANKRIGGTKGEEPEETLAKSSVLAELERRALKAEAALRDKEEENNILHQRLQQYESRWSEYEQKMESMEEVWQKQMASLQSSLSVAKNSFAIDDIERHSVASLDQSWSSTDPIRAKGWENGKRSVSRAINRDMNSGLSVISRLSEEFEQRTQVFADDAKFLMEVKSGKSEVSLNPERELRRLKQDFELWKKDFSSRLREAKMGINKLGTDDAGSDKGKRKWWVRLNSRRIIPLGGCHPSGHLPGRPGHCDPGYSSDCCEAGKSYPQYRCSPPITGHTRAKMTVNCFEENCDGGGPSECDDSYHSDKEMVVALSTGWYAGGSRCHGMIRIHANGQSVLAKVVDECDSVNGCDEEHDFQPPCPNNVVDASPAVWKALGISTDVGVYHVT
ncbi:myosin-2 heavy chain, non muscle, partial [Musa troglodytarum]